MARRKSRNRWTFAAGTLLWSFCSIGMYLSGGQRANSPINYAIAGSVFFTICYFSSLMSMFSWVKLTPAALVVQNPGSRWVIPWSKVQGVKYERGLYIEIKDRSGPVRSMAYQGSLLGQLAGWPSSRKAAEAIEKYQQTGTAENGNSRVLKSFPWRAHLLWLVIGWTALAVVMPAFGRCAT